MALDEIKEYWDQRAEESPQAATTNDVYLRRVESAALLSQLNAVGVPPEARILDIGCGDGATTSAIARNFPSARFYGIDFSAEMVGLAKARRESEQISFVTGDVRNLTDQFSVGSFDVIMTNRCLINLRDKDEQFAALGQIRECLAPGGYYFGTENFVGGQAALNSLRRSLGLEEIPVRWHNLYFDEAEFISMASTMFTKVELINFSSTYYLVTRVVYSALCKREGVQPGYEHPIYDIAASLPAAGDFSPIKLILARA